MQFAPASSGLAGALPTAISKSPGGRAAGLLTGAAVKATPSITTTKQPATAPVGSAVADQGTASMFDDPRILGHVFAAPYGVFEPSLAFVADDEAGVGGYIVGALDSRAFEERLEAEWWPALRDRRGGLRRESARYRSPIRWRQAPHRVTVAHPGRGPRRSSRRPFAGGTQPRQIRWSGRSGAGQWCG